LDSHMEKQRKDSNMTLEDCRELEEGLACVREHGYVHTLHFCAHGWLCKETNKVYGPQELVMDFCHRFQWSGGKHRVSVLYAVRAQDGTKGIIMDTCTTYGNAQFGEYLLQMKLRQSPGAWDQVSEPKSRKTA
jgi:hypothetical protein